MPATEKRPRPMFDAEELFSYEEVAARLKATPRQVRRWTDDRKFNPDGIVALPRGRRIYGWALNEFIAQRVLGA